MELSWTHVLADGLRVTVELSLLTIGLSVLMSAILAALSIAPWWPVRVCTRFIVDFFRTVPVLALLIFVYYGLGRYIASLGLSPFQLAVIALTIGESAFLSEIFRAGFEAIPRGQWEAAKSLGFDWRSSLRLVIAPQALLPSIPGIVNMSIFTFKDSALASVIAVPEVTQRANQLVADTFKPLQVYLMLAIFYLAVILPFTYMASLAERRINRYFGGHTEVAVIRN